MKNNKSYENEENSRFLTQIAHLMPLKFAMSYMIEDFKKGK